MGTEHYRGTLGGSERGLYAAVYQGLCALESAVRVPLLPMRTISDVFAVLRLDHPEIFYVTGFRIRSVPGAEYGELLPDYLFDRGKIRTHREAIAARTERLLRQPRKLDEAGRQQFVHDFLCTVRYDKLKKPYSHEVLGPLTQGVGVCEGIAKTCKLLCDTLGIPCVVALSAPRTEEGQKYGHAWNVIRLQGGWYHLDATFDGTLSHCGETRYDYYDLDDAHILRDHREPVYPVPACTDGGSFYYKQNRLSLTKPEDVTRLVTQAARKKRAHVVFHWRGGYLTRESLPDILAAAAAGAEAAGRYAAVSLNWAQAVFFVSFPAQPPAGSVALEQVEE